MPHYVKLKQCIPIHFPGASIGKFGNLTAMPSIPAPERRRKWCLLLLVDALWWSEGILGSADWKWDTGQQFGDLFKIVVMNNCSTCWIHRVLNLYALDSDFTKCKYSYTSATTSGRNIAVPAKAPKNLLQEYPAKFTWKCYEYLYEYVSLAILTSDNLEL